MALYKAQRLVGPIRELVQIKHERCVSRHCHEVDGDADDVYKKSTFELKKNHFGCHTEFLTKAKKNYPTYHVPCVHSWGRVGYGIGRSRHGKHEGEGAGQSGRHHQKQGMNPDCHALKMDRYFSNNQDFGGNWKYQVSEDWKEDWGCCDVWGHFGCCCCPNADDQEKNPLVQILKTNQMVADPLRQACTFQNRLRFQLLISMRWLINLKHRMLWPRWSHRQGEGQETKASSSESWASPSAKETAWSRRL